MDYGDYDDSTAGYQDSFAEISPADLEEYVRGVDFPADKKQILATVEDDGAPSQVLTLLHTLPEQEYEDALEVTEAIGTTGLYEDNPEEQLEPEEGENRHIYREEEEKEEE